MYAVDQTTSKANSAVIHGYSTSTQTWTRYTGNSSGASDSFVAGAVNPATGIYYYVTYGTGLRKQAGNRHRLRLQHQYEHPYHRRDRDLQPADGK